MSASGSLVDTSIVRAGVPGVKLEGELVSLTVFPDAGGKVLDLVDRESGVDLLWQNPRVGLARTHAGAPFDDVWCGGWDDVFPTDAPCVLDGNGFHDHGDLWIGPWEWGVEEDGREQATLWLRRHSASLPCVLEKRITVRRDARFVTVRYRLENLGSRAVRFVWNLHVAHRVETGSLVRLPAAALGVTAPYVGRAGDAGECTWPLHHAGDATHDLSRVPGPDSGLVEYFWPRELAGGWCAVTHPAAGVGLGLSFDRDLFRTVWLFGDYGGWRGHHFLLTEPCTSAPGSLASAVADGTAAALDGGEVVETIVVATVLEHEEASPVARPTGLVSVEEVVR